MRGIIGTAAAMALLALPGQAQVPLDPASHAAIADILNWRDDKQATGFRGIETIFRTHTIRRGKAVHPLPLAARRIDPTFSHAGRTWTIDQYMAAYRVSGVLVLKDGRILMEKYGLGRKPTDRWTSFSVAKSVTSTLVGAAIQDGYIKDIHDPVTRYVPDLKGSAYEGVTVRQMLMMSSGVTWNEDYVDPKSDVAQAGGDGPRTLGRPHGDGRGGPDGGERALGRRAHRRRPAPAEHGQRDLALGQVAFAVDPHVAGGHPGHAVDRHAAGVHRHQIAHRHRLGGGVVQEHPVDRAEHLVLHSLVGHIADRG